MARLSQQELADAVGVARQSISYWENGAQIPTDANLIALRHALGDAFGSETDAVFSTLQRLHGQSLELEALNRYLLSRQAAFSEELARATNPYSGDDSGEPEAAAIRPAGAIPASGDAPRPAQSARSGRKG